MPTYNLVTFEKAGEAYQEVDCGCVTRYLAADGRVLFVQPPIGESCRVVRSNEAPTAKILAAPAVKYDPAVSGERRQRNRRASNA